MSSKLEDRLVDFPDRESWLLARRNGIGASEAASVLGLNPYESPLELFLRKTGRMEFEPENDAMRLGTLLEPIISDEYTRRTGVPLRRQVFTRHETHEWMFATLDGLRPDGKVVEIKTAGFRSAKNWGDEDTDDIPAPYLCQVHHQMACTDTDEADVFVLIGGQEFRMYTVHRNEDLIESLIEREREFWESVQRNTPPKIEMFKPGDADLLLCLYPETTGAVILATDDMRLIDDWLESKEAAKEAKERSESFKAAVMAIMGSYATAKLPDGRIVSRKLIESTVVNAKPYVRKSYIDLRVKKGSAN